MSRSIFRTVWLAGLVLAAGAARADEFADFRIPDHRVLSWTGDFAGSAWENTQQSGDSQRRTSRFGGTTSSALHWFRDSDAGRGDLRLSSFIVGNRERSDADGFNANPAATSGFEEAATTRQVSEQWAITTEWLRYTGPGPLTLGVDASLALEQRQGWRADHRYRLYADSLQRFEDLSESHSRERTSTARLSLRPRFGVGRVRDASGLYLARAIEDRLQRSGTLARPLTHAARQALSDLLTLRAVYGDLHERPAKDLWAEIARICRDDGALAGAGVEASSAMRAGESLLEALSTGPSPDGLPRAIVLRQRGACATAFLEVSDLRRSRYVAGGGRRQVTIDGVPDLVSSNSYDAHDVTTSDATSGGLQVEWHRPVGMRLQFDASAEASVPLRSRDDGFTTHARLDATRIVTDRWYLGGSLVHSREVRRNAGSGSTLWDRWAVQAEIRVSYELEDHATVALALRESQDLRHRALYGPWSGDEYNRDLSAALGLTYRFAGRFFAPGFPELSERTPPAAGF